MLLWLLPGLILTLNRDVVHWLTAMSSIGTFATAGGL
jgi:hypothetical protein